MSDLDKFLKIKREAEQAQQQADRAEGALQETLKGMKASFGCKTIEEANKLLKKLERSRDKAKKQFDREMRTFEKKWRNHI